VAALNEILQLLVLSSFAMILVSLVSARIRIVQLELLSVQVYVFSMTIR
jgi:hypothetical protein